MAWVDLLLLANHDVTFFRVRDVRVQVNRGQVGYSTLTLAARWKWSRGKVTRYLTELEKDEKIVQQKNRITTLISILNYEQYQGDGTTDGQQTDNRRTHLKNVKNVKNVKKPLIQKEEKSKMSVPEQPVLVVPVGFDHQWFDLWKQYHEYRLAEKKGWFRSQKTEQQAIANFFNDCHGDIAIASEALKKTIGSRWTGLFPPKNSTNGQQLNQASGSKSGSQNRTSGTLFNIGTAGEF